VEYPRAFMGGFLRGLTKLVAVREIAKRTVMEKMFYKKRQHLHLAMLLPRFSTPPRFRAPNELRKTGLPMGMLGVGWRKKRASESPNFNFDESLDKSGQGVVHYPQRLQPTPFRTRN